MTRQAVFHSASPFSDWLRQLPAPWNSTRFDSQNLDYVWFAYRDGWLILIEEKRNGGRRSMAQQDTHDLVDQMLRSASGKPFKTARGVRPIDYRGYFLVSFENATPDDSRWVRINGRLYNDPRAAVLELLLFGHQPVEKAA